MHSLFYIALDTIACDCIAYFYVLAFTLHFAQHDWIGFLSFDWALCDHLFRGFAYGIKGCMWDFGFLYLAAGVGILSTPMVYRAHGSTSHSMSYAWIVI